MNQFPIGRLGENPPFTLDNLSRKERSERMSRIRSKDTNPEWAVRRLVHGMGFRYRLHSRGLPGTPDLVFRGRSKVIFVHGCFWHLHKDCNIYRLPKSKKDFWLPKLKGNRKRDFKNQKLLRKTGWEFLVVWECELKMSNKLSNRIKSFLEL